MSTYLYSKWKNAPVNRPAEYYSELDESRWETRKVEVFRDGRLGFASAMESTPDTELGIVPVPSLAEIESQLEFDVRLIEAEEFEALWKRATAQSRSATSKGTQPNPRAVA
jgi:hypothetical protein